jgi:hypothetical protein
MAAFDIRYSDLACPTCGAGPLHSCWTLTEFEGWSRNYQFQYTHAARRHLWWARDRTRRTK